MYSIFILKCNQNVCTAVKCSSFGNEQDLSKTWHSELKHPNSSQPREMFSATFSQVILPQIHKPGEAKHTCKKSC